MPVTEIWARAIWIFLDSWIHSTQRLMPPRTAISRVALETRTSTKAMAARYLTALCPYSLFHSIRVWGEGRVNDCVLHTRKVAVVEPTPATGIITRAIRIQTARPFFGRDCLLSCPVKCDVDRDITTSHTLLYHQDYGFGEELFRTLLHPVTVCLKLIRPTRRAGLATVIAADCNGRNAASIDGGDRVAIGLEIGSV